MNPGSSSNQGDLIGLDIVVSGRIHLVMTKVPYTQIWINISIHMVLESSISF